MPDLFNLFISLLWAVSIGSAAWLIAGHLSQLRLEHREYEVELPLLFRLFLPAVPQFKPYVRRPSLERLCNQTDARLIQAGLDQYLSAEEFVTLRGLYLAFFTPLGMIFLVAGSIMGLIFGLTLLFFGMLFPNIWLGSQIRRRHRIIQRALPSVLDLLTLSVEAGRDFLTALKDILRHRPHDPLSDELERVFREVQLGKQRREALKNMGLRVNQPDLTSVVDALVQADELGVSLSSILRILGDQMRQKRFHRAEKLANEAPVKLLFPLMLFIFPAVILIMLGPLILDSPIMQFIR